MWLDRLSGQSTPSTSPVPWNHAGSPAPGRSSLHLTRNAANLRRPELPKRVSSWSGLINGSSDSISTVPRAGPSTNLRGVLQPRELASSEPIDTLRCILSDSRVSHEAIPEPLHDIIEQAKEVDFSGLSLRDFANSSGQEDTDATTVKRDTSDLEELHSSLRSCDDILVSVEKSLTVFQADLAAVSTEIETLQNKSTSLSQKLQRRKSLEKKLTPEVDKLVLSPLVVRKISDGPLDENWAEALQELEKALKAHENVLGTHQQTKAIEDVNPLLLSLRERAVERIRDHVVAQIKALRSPSINAQLLQRNALSKFREAYAFLAKHQPKLEEEISRAYINTMRWYYSSSFTRYKAAIERMALHTIEKTDTIAQDESVRRSNPANPSKPGSGPFDTFSLGRRIDVLKSSNPQAISSFVAEEDKSVHCLETLFRTFNLALVDNASAEFSFMTEFFSEASINAVSKRFLAVFDPTLQIGQQFTKQLVDNNSDALGILICVRLNQRFAFELQRRKVSPMEGYINGTSMLLWPRFQVVMDNQCESLRKASASLPGRPLGSALNLTSGTSGASSVAPHPTTQRFANFIRGILHLSDGAGDDEPVQRSLGRLKDEYLTFLMKLSKSISDSKKRERFLFNNYSLIETIIVDTRGKLSEEFKEIIANLREASGVSTGPSS